MAYTKLDSGITDSTIWQAPDTTRIVWITMLAMADQNGYIGASMPGLAGRARVSLEACIEAIRTLESPDTWSRTQDHEGRRVAPADGGWVLLNHAKYRAEQNAEDRRERSRIAMAKLRAERKGATVAPSEPPLAPVTPPVNLCAKLIQAEAEAEVTPSIPSFLTPTVGVPAVVDASASLPPATVEKPKKPKAQPTKGTRLPDDFQLPKAWGEWALTKYPHWPRSKVVDEALKFANHWHAAVGRAAMKADWYATWQNWCMSDIAHRDDPRPNGNAVHQGLTTPNNPGIAATQRLLLERDEASRNATPPPAEILALRSKRA